MDGEKTIVRRSFENIRGHSACWFCPSLLENITSSNSYDQDLQRAGTSPTARRIARRPEGDPIRGRAGTEALHAVRAKRVRIVLWNIWKGWAVRGKNPRAVPLVITRAGTPVSNVIAAQRVIPVAPETVPWEGFGISDCNHSTGYVSNGRRPRLTHNAGKMGQQAGTKRRGPLPKPWRLRSDILTMNPDSAGGYTKARSMQHRDALLLLGKHLTWRDGDVVLDVGCGTGEIASLQEKKKNSIAPQLYKNRALSDGHNPPYVLLRAVYVQKRGQTHIADQKEVATVVGLDISKDMVNFATSSNTTEKASFHVLDIQDGSGIREDWRGRFTKAVSFHTVHWIPDKERFLANVHLCLEKATQRVTESSRLQPQYSSAFVGDVLGSEMLANGRCVEECFHWAATTQGERATELRSELKWRCVRTFYEEYVSLAALTQRKERQSCGRSLSHCATVGDVLCAETGIPTIGNFHEEYMSLAALTQSDRAAVGV
ncbi:hypothetical protein Bbelb_168720 [Branchiostoma belcheri]|nr:hypothetical protein Bbelb_168720 [Branchiostoma belcheri]